MSKVSVIMNCLNGENFLREAIDSIYAQTFTDWEIIFWDNVSTDKSAEIAKSYDDKIKYFKSETFGTLGKGRNEAFRRATGDYLAILDVDDKWCPTKLEKQVEVFEKYPETGMVFANSMFFSDAGDLFDIFSKFPPPKTPRIFESLLKTGSGYISSESVMFRKTFLDELDYLFDDNFTMVMDYELMLRLAHKHEIRHVDEILSKWRMHENSESVVNYRLIPEESMKMLERILSNYPDIPEKYPDALGEYQRGQVYMMGLADWKEGKTWSAFKYFSKYWRNKRFFLSMCLVWLMSNNRFELIKKKLRESYAKTRSAIN